MRKPNQLKVRLYYRVRENASLSFERPRRKGITERFALDSLRPVLYCKNSFSLSAQALTKEKAETINPTFIVFVR
jgi:Tfp pilus assembly protein PilP